MLKTILATGLAACIAYDVTVAPGYSDILGLSGSQSSLNERFPIGPDCTQTAWPNYDSKCVRNRTQPSEPPGLTRQVRIVAIERQPTQPFAKP